MQIIRIQMMANTDVFTPISGHWSPKSRDGRKHVLGLLSPRHDTPHRWDLVFKQRKWVSGNEMSTGRNNLNVNSRPIISRQYIWHCHSLFIIFINHSWLPYLQWEMINKHKLEVGRLRFPRQAILRCAISMFRRTFSAWAICPHRAPIFCRSFSN